MLNGCLHRYLDRPAADPPPHSRIFTDSAQTLSPANQYPGHTTPPCRNSLARTFVTLSSILLPQVLITGTDIPDLSAPLLARAVAALDEYEVGAGVEVEGSRTGAAHIQPASAPAWSAPWPRSDEHEVGGWVW